MGVKNEIPMSEPTKRRKRVELRRVMLDLGVEMLRERGLDGGAPHILLADVFKRAEEQMGIRVTPASVYKRIWETQQDYQQDVLASAVALYPNSEEVPTRDAVRVVLAARQTTTPEQRWAILRDICRVIGDVHLDALQHSRAWQIWVGAWAITVSTPTLEDDRVLGPVIENGHDQSTAKLGELFGEILDTLGFRLRAPYTIGQLALSFGALAEGMALRDRFVAGDASVKVLFPDASDRWSIFGISIWALVREFLEIDPEWKPVPSEQPNVAPFS